MSEYATAQLARPTRGELRQRSEKLFTEAFHKALHDGGCDAILGSLRPSYDTAAEAISKARELIPADTPAEQFLRTAKPAAVTAWRGLDTHCRDRHDRPHRRTVRAANRELPADRGYALGDGFRLDDRALWCTDGPNLELDSAVFRRPDQGHRTSPWFRLPVRLHTSTRRGTATASGPAASGNASTPDRWPPSSTKTARYANCRGRKPL
jgi:hypothetical protein